MITKLMDLKTTTLLLQLLLLYKSQIEVNDAREMKRKR